MCKAHLGDFMEMLSGGAIWPDEYYLLRQCQEIMVHEGKVRSCSYSLGFKYKKSI